MLYKINILFIKTHAHKEKHSNNLGSSWNFLLKNVLNIHCTFIVFFINFHISYLILNIQCHSI